MPTSRKANASEKLTMNENPLDATSNGRFSLNNSCEKKNKSSIIINPY